ncbi:MAG: hypothetical protein PVF63_00170 [Gammaproteobacteria bacterium]|jgi:hypothetical protein
MSDNDHEDFVRRTRELFDREVSGLDAATRSKLNRARQRALAELDRPAASLLRAPLPQATFAVIAMAAVGGLLFLRAGMDSGDATPDFAEASDIEILLAEDDMAFLEELEFYVWLEELPEFEGPEDSIEGAG